MKKDISKIHINKLRILSFFLLFSLIMPFVALSVKAENSFGISGTFTDYRYKMVPGESITTPDVYVMFFNNYDTEITVEYYTSGPEGVEFLFDNIPVKIPANKTVKVPISLKVDEKTVPGNYEIGVAAKVIPDEVNGVILAPSTKLNATISILGEAGEFIIKTVDYQEEPFKSTIRLYREDDDGTYAVATSETGILEDRMVPGNYTAYAYYNEQEIGRKKFTLKANDDLEIILPVETVFIPTFSATAQFESNGELIRNAQLVYTIDNIFNPIENAKLILSVLRNEEKLETTELLAFPTLLVGKTEGRYSYIPSNAWENGVYTFKLQVLDQNNQVLANSFEQSILVDQFPFNWIPVLIGTIGVLVASLIGALFKGSLLNLGFIKWFTLLFANKKHVAYNERLDIKYTSIQTAIDEAKAFDTILVYKGVHNELITINKAIQLVGQESTSSNGKTKFKANSSLDNVAMVTISSSHVYLKNILFIGDETIDCAIQINSSHVNVSECAFEGFINPIVIQSETNDEVLEKVSIVDCRFVKSHHAALLIEEASVVIDHNDFNRVKYAISINNKTAEITISNNKITYIEDDLLIYYRTTLEGVELIENSINQIDSSDKS